MNRRVTIEDIARQANASITTVSLVLRDKPGIGAKTRQRVLTVARELGYRPRTPLADSTSTRNVALILRSRIEHRHAPLPSVNPFYAEVMTGIETMARAEHINLLYTTLPVDGSNHPYELPEHVLRQPLDGILLIGAFFDETVSAIADMRLTPTVLVDAPARRSQQDAVVSDNEGGTHDAVQYLIHHGHRQIAFVGPDLDLDPNFMLRRQGYLTAMEGHGLAPVFITDRAGMHAVARATTAALGDHPEITAMVGANDASAIEALRGAADAGRRVPDDLSIIGFDDVALASQVTPRLTTMAIDRITMGRQAVQMLRHRLTWPDSCPLMTVLRPVLHIRDSVTEAPNAPKPHGPTDRSAHGASPGN